MQCKFAASIGGASANICRTAAVNRVLKAFNSGVQCGALWSSNRSSHSSSEEDDTFAELGTPVTECAVSQLKLATEKPEPEHFMWKNGSAKQILPNKFPHVKEHGNRGTISTCDESCESTGERVMERIRIYGIGENESIHEIHSLCKKFGNLEGLTWVSKDAVDALFTVGSESDLKIILKKLNGNSNGRCLSASLLSDDEVVWRERCLQSRIRFNEARRKLLSKKLDVDNLEMLYNAIIHLQRTESRRTPKLTIVKC